MASTTEPKGEIQDVAEDVFTETLRYKTWILKLSIHCPACGKKVTKILKKIDGVYITEVDFAQQRVTVIGDVEPEIMIKALSKKTSKHVELIRPETKANPEENQCIPKSKEKQSYPNEASEERKENHSDGEDKKKGKQPVKSEVVKVVESGGGGSKNFEAGSSSYTKSVEEPDGGKQSEGGEKQAVDEKSGAVDGDGSGDGGGKKENKSKKQNVNVTEGKITEIGDVAPSTAPPAQTGPLRQPQPQVANVQTTVPKVQKPFPMPLYHDKPQQREVHDHPRQQQQPFEHPHPRQQQCFTPVHAMNYRVAHPSVSNDTARYAAPPADPQTHTYAHWGLENEFVDPLLDSLPAALPSHQHQHPYNSSDSSDAFSYFSDENPNACSIM
ncbi:heavy metal-associated isoprenylated plant protein 36-like [Argentina anserina]|uniref:heavy metal-associated isoprenylated plant protein 36-like n=1 Tax=Argentina anserina TaxID=57926 RepID=UPI002176527F|nr:heavy metal-associated isoprenylated plant protein 36-like [Potentilla anserina]